MRSARTNEGADIFPKRQLPALSQEWHRAGKLGWLRAAVLGAMVSESLLTQADGLARLDGIDLKTVVRTSFGPPVLAVAQVASMEVASGAIALEPAAVNWLATAGTSAILVRRDTVTSDIEGMALAVGILTAPGGRTSHAAVVTRQLRKVCLVACPDLEIEMDHRPCQTAAQSCMRTTFRHWMASNTGSIHAGQLELVTERPEQALTVIAGWRLALAA